MDAAVNGVAHLQPGQKVSNRWRAQLDKEVRARARWISQ
jgi:hypothetical protein